MALSSFTAADLLTIRARVRRLRVTRQYGTHRSDPLTGANVRVIRDAIYYGIGRTEYPPPAPLFQSGELVVPAYPWGTPDVP